ncbi:MAG TPA: DUF3151 domain-containing protein [Actinocrinis sp.]|nr:DUF3151 domain-containing protein [Actinocrinis sp.]
MHENLLGGPAPTLLPEDDAAEPLAAGQDPTEVAAAFPASSLAWAYLAELALGAGQPVTAYAYARTGYHRGLDALRRSGWKGHGPIPAAHTPNQGFLRALAALGQAAAAIGEQDEADRCGAFLLDAASTDNDPDSES